MNDEFVSRSPMETVASLLELGRANAAVEVLRQQPPAAAHEIIKQLLLGGNIDGPQAITLIRRSIPYEHWNELGIQSIEGRQ